MKRDDYSMPKLEQAQARRQAILDHLRAHPLATYAELVEAANESVETMRGIIAHMLHTSEIAATGEPRRYVALVDTTISAEAVREAYLERQKKNNARNAAAYAARKREHNKANTMKRYKQAQDDRQAVLDYLNAKPGASTRAVMDNVNSTRAAPMDLNRVSQTLGRMATLGEVHRERGGALDPTGKRCSAWHPLKKETASWESMRDLVAHNLYGEKPKPAGRPGVTTYHSGDNPEISRFRSGGQGGVAPASIGSGMYGGMW